MSNDDLAPFPLGPPDDVVVERVQADSQPLSDNDKLIAVLQSCFSTLLEKQDGIQKAVEALKLPVPVADEKSTFWTSYMKLADEHDKEFTEKYSTDLDTTLIFSGLFSAIVSAFIIQIQPQMVPIQSTPITIIVVQSLLYISMFTTLLAALLTVLGKQWIMHYQAAGSRGTIEERGLERQRKLDGLKKWKFDTVLQAFPLLLQAALLLFSTALSIYLWTVHVSIAIIVLVSTALGFSLYLFFLGSAALFPDSPFQSPLAQVLARMISLAQHALRPWQRLEKTWQILTETVNLSWRQIHKYQAHLLPCFTTRTSIETYRKSPPWETNLEWYLSRPSTEAPAVLWILETSTDPTMISTAAKMGVHLCWPLNLDPALSINRLHETFYSCFHWSYDPDKRHIREGMVDTAIACGMVYCFLRHISQVQGSHVNIFPFVFPFNQEDIPEACPSDLRIVLGILHGIPDVIIGSEMSQVAKWALKVIPSLDCKTTFGGSLHKPVEYFLNQFLKSNMLSLSEEEASDYLCCLNSFFGPVNPQILKQQNRSNLKIFLMTQLLKELQSNIMDTPLATKIVTATSQLLSNGLGPCSIQFGRLGNFMTEVAQFCSSVHHVDGWLDLVVSVTMLARVTNHQGQPLYYQEESCGDGNPLDIDWIYMALEHLESLPGEEMGQPRKYSHDEAVEGLLAVLAWAQPTFLVRKPSDTVLMAIIRALSAGNKASLWAFFVMTRAHTWFKDSNLKQILQQQSVLTHLASIALENRGSEEVGKHFLELGNNIAGIPEWRAILHREILTWIITFESIFHWEEVWSIKFVSVLRQIWVPNSNDRYEFRSGHEESWALALIAVGQAFETNVFNTSPTSQQLDLARAAVLVAFRVNHYFHTNTGLNVEPIPYSIRTIFAPEFGKCLGKAADKILNRIQPTEQHIHGSSTPFAAHGDGLGDASTQIASGEMGLGGSVKSYRNWGDLQHMFWDEIDSIEQSVRLGTVHFG
ncbi:hypothetical protein K438DRAFT_1827055 [Mycena galopus ATCC 62051]|nr:hypothetical protein K438DRAFT_1827055 [Mycena galopus ATCC 62051]